MKENVNNIINRVFRDELFYMGFRQEDFSDTDVVYSTYLLKTREKAVLIGTPPVKYVEEWIACIEEKVALEEIGWCIVFGEETDRTAIRRLLEGNREITIVAGTVPLYKINGFLGVDYRSIEIRNNRTLLLGGVELEFRVLQDKRETPSLYVIDKREGVLFTADAFGAIGAFTQGCTGDIAEEERYLRGAGKYIWQLFGTDRIKGALRAVELVRENQIKCICPAYGPVVDSCLQELLALYEMKKAADGTHPILAIVFDPEEYVREAVHWVAEGAKESNAVQVREIDLRETGSVEVLEQLADTDAILFAGSEKNGDVSKRLWDILNALDRKQWGGKLSVFLGNGSTDGEFAEGFCERLGFLGFDTTTANHIFLGRPDEAARKAAYEYGFDLSCVLQRIPNPRKPKLVKCLVCGEIFDASLGICPVCGVGLEQCVPVDGDSAAYKRDTEQTYLILGGGTAAVSAAAAIRLRDGTGRIILYSAEEYLPINRPMLTKDLKAVAEDPMALLIHTADWFEENRIEIHTGHAAEKIDVAAKTVEVSGVGAVSYDRLIIATGAECFIPPFGGADRPEVITIRHLEDNRKLEAFLKTAKNAVVIGGGVLGLEAASELLRAGIRVTVLEASPQIIGRQVDRATADVLLTVMKKMGADCYEAVSIEEIEGDHEGHVTGVRLADGRVFPADFVVVSCGNRGNTKIAADAGIDVDRSIVVDQRMRTNQAHIYACGDCAQFDGINYQLWQEATEQGRVAGANAAGEALTYAAPLLGLNLEGFGTTLFAIGDPGKKENVKYRTVEIKDSVSNTRENYWFAGNALQGAVLIGRPDKVAVVSNQVTTHAGHSEMF